MAKDLACQEDIYWEANIMTTYEFVPAIYSKKSTPLAFREYVMKGTMGPVGTKQEIIDFIKKKDPEGKIKIHTLEGEVELL